MKNRTSVYKSLIIFFSLTFFMAGHNEIHSEDEPETVFKIDLNVGHMLNYFEATSSSKIETAEDLLALDGLSRETLEMLIFQLAPKIGGCHCRVEFVSSDQNNRIDHDLAQLRHAVEIGQGIGAFAGDPKLKEEFYLSEPILDGEDFFVGLYTAEHRAELLALNDLTEIMDLTFVVGKGWEVDRMVIEEYGFEMITAKDWEELLEFLSFGKADVVMQPFKMSEDFGFYDDLLSIYFKPIPNIRLNFNQDRVYLVSKWHPNGKEFLTHLDAGIKQMKADGVIEKALAKAGVINPRTDKFKELVAPL